MKVYYLIRWAFTDQILIPDKVKKQGELYRKIGGTNPHSYIKLIMTGNELFRLVVTMGIDRPYLNFSAR